MKKILSTIICVPLSLVGGIGFGLLLAIAQIIYTPIDLLVSILCDIWGA